MEPGSFVDAGYGAADGEESEMDAELRFHMQAYAADLKRQGVAHEDAMRRARIEFGGVERAKEECCDARGVSFAATLL